MNYDHYIKKSQAFYKTLINTFCPYLKSNVEFTAKGFNHLVYKSDRTRRNESEVYTRMCALPLVAEIISSSGTLQEIEKLESGQVYYAFIAIINDKKYKVIVSSTHDDRYLFRSVIPRWKTGKRDKKLDH